MDTNAEFKVALKSENGNAVSLGRMSAAALDSFLQMVEALRAVVRETVADEEALRFSFEEGSAAAVWRGPEAKIVQLTTGLERAIAGESDSADLTKNTRRMQEQLRRENWHYEVDYRIAGSKVVSLRERLVSGPTARKAGRRLPYTFRLKILHGFLNEIGGNDPNYHFDYGGGEKLKVACSRPEATRVKDFLYRDVDVLVMKKEWEDEDKKPEYSHQVVLPSGQVATVKAFLADYYSSDDLLEKLDRFYQFAETHLPTENGLALMNTLLRGFNHDSADRNEWKTLLVITKGFANHAVIAEARAALLDRYNEAKG